MATRLPILLLLVLHEVGGDGTLQLKFKEFRNPFPSRNSNSQCCSGNLPFCSGSCQPHFTVCYRGGTSNGPCLVTKDSVTFFVPNSVSHTITFGNTNGIFNLTFQDSAPDKHYVVIQAVDAGGANMDTLSPALESNLTSQTATLTGSRTSLPTILTFEWRMFCASNWYGAACGTLCVAQDTLIPHAHYTCNTTTGDKICNPGYNNAARNCSILVNSPDQFVTIKVDGTVMDASSLYNVTTEKNVALEAVYIGGKALVYTWAVTGPGSFDVAEMSFAVVFDKVGVYAITVYVTQPLGALEATTRIQAEEAIVGLEMRLHTDTGFFAVNETEGFDIFLQKGSHFTLRWTFHHLQSMERNEYLLSKLITQLYTFSNVGTYRITLLVQNDVSNGTDTRIVYVQMPLTNFHIIFDGKVADGRRLNVAAGIPIAMETAVSGTEGWYKWVISDDIDMDVTARSCGLNEVLGQNSSLAFALPSSGLQLLVACAINDVMSRPVLAHAWLNVQEPIGEGRLIAYPSTTILKNTKATLTAKLAGGSSILYNWTVTDPAGSVVAEVVSNTSSLQFNFTSEGAYTVSVVAHNEASNGDRLETLVYVQSRLCLPPLLAAITLPLIQEQFRSRHFRLEVSATPNCTLNRIRYQWTVYHKQKGVACSVKGEESTLVNMEEIGTIKPIIAIPKRFLHLGTYCFRFEASLGSALSTESFMVSIVESDIVAVIKGGDSRLVGALQQLTLDGSNSYDPDDNEETAQEVKDGLSYLWICRSALSTSSNGMCETITDNKLFVEGHNCFDDGQVALPVVKIEENTLRAGRTYLFELHVMKGGRTATAQQQVCVAGGDTPDPPVISCLSCKRYGTEEFIRSRRTELVVPCLTEGSCAAQHFRWRLFNVTTDDNPVQAVLNSQMTPTGTTGRNLVVNSNVLDSRTVYRFELTVTEKHRDGAGFASLTLRPNAPPRGGTCDVSPRQGTTLSTQFTFTCTGWADNDLPLEYRFATSRKKNALRRNRTVLYTGFRSQYVANSLPLGDKRNNYTIYAFVSVVDRFGGKTEVKMDKEVVVEPLTNTFDTTAVEEAALNAIERVENEFGDDPQRVTETCGSIMETINMAADSDDARGETVQTDRSIRAGLRQTCVEKLGKQTVESAEDAARIGPVLVKATRNPKEFVNRTAQKAALDTIAKIIYAVGIAGDSERTEESVAQVLEVVSNIIAAEIENAIKDQDSSYADVEERGEELEELNRNIVNQVENIGKVIAESHVVGEGPAVVETPQVTVIASKTDPANVGSESSSLVYRDIGFSLSRGFATELRNKTNSSEILQSVYSFNTNPFYYSDTSKRVNSKVVGLVFKTTSNEEIQIDNLPHDSEVIVTLPRTTDPLWNTTETTVESHNYTFLRFNLSTLASDEAISIEVRLLDSYRVGSASSTSDAESEAVEVYFVQDEGPTNSDVTAESYQFTLTLDMFNHTSNITHQNYTIFLLASSIKTDTNQFVGLRSLHSQLGFNVSVRIFYSACLFWDEKNGSFSSHGCQPTALTTFDSSVCRCNHLTSFAAGMFPAPNPIDFSLFLKLDIASNPIALATLIVVYVVYVVAVVFARRADLRDERYVKEVPFCGPDGPFVYQISVQTGFWFGSGTTANVGIVLFAGDTASGKRHLYKQRAFRRSSLDVFQVALNERIGPIDKIRVWHDNTGKSPSWNLHNIQIQDLQSGESSAFVINEWLSVDSDTGLLDMEISLATDEDLKRFSNVFSAQTSRGFSEKHLWFSIVERPARSRFTRVQRVTCCFCLFISFVTASAMWYGVAPEDKADFDLGFASMSYQQIGISIMATAVTFPLNIIWITMFRKAGLRSVKEKKTDNDMITADNCAYEAATSSVPTDDPVLVSFKDSAGAADENKPVSQTSLNCPASADVLCSGNGLANKEEVARSQDSKSDADDKAEVEEPSVPKKRNFQLPHFFVYVAYVGCLVTCVAGSVIILIYGQQFGRTKALRWVATMFLSFFESVLFFEPLKVFVIAAFLALLIKPKSTTEDDVVLHVEVKHVEGVEMEEVKALTDYDRSAARIRRQKHKHMMEVLWEIILYFIFLWLVTIIAYTDRDKRAYTMTRVSEKLFDAKGSYSHINTGGDFFKWANSTLVDGLYWHRWYNGDPVLGSGFIRGNIGKLLGGARLRQIRVKNDSCDVAGNFAEQINQCYSQRKAGNEHGSFGVGWTNGRNITDPPWRWSSSSDLDGVAYWGKLGAYSGNGYVQYLGDTSSQARSVLATLNSNLWIDRQTRAVFVEFTLYNANVNLFQSVTFLVEFLATGGAVPSHQFLSIRLIRYISSLDALKMACELIFVIFILLYTYRFFNDARKTGMRTFVTFFWSWVDMCYLLLSYAAIIYGIYRIVAINDLLSRYSDSRGHFINFYPTVLANMSMQYVLAFLGFLVTIKVLKLFRFNRRMTMLSMVLKAAAFEMVSVIVLLALLLWSFAQFGYLVLQENVGFRSPSAAVSTLFSTVLGDFDFYGWVEADKILAPIMFFCFNLLVFFILLSVFVAILNISVNSVRQSILEQANDFEVLDYMLKRFRLWLGLKSKATEEGKRNVSDSATSPLSMRGIHIMDLGPETHYSDRKPKDVVESGVVDLTRNTDMIRQQSQADFWMNTLSTKMDTILQLLDGLFPNQDEVEQGGTSHTLQ